MTAESTELLVTFDTSQLIDELKDLRSSGMPKIRFTVDSALLEELGERLVGKPYIALAELVKNSYDADAHHVVIEISPDQDRIEVLDDGHGMVFEEFRDFWMRIGSPHKRDQQTSRYLGRPMTGSKGVGRLAVQFLAEELSMWTVPRTYQDEWLEAYIAWSDAVQTGELTEATVEYTLRASDLPFESGTLLVLSGLKQSWTTDQIEDLARELWWLQPPFRRPARDSQLAAQAFEIEFRSTQPEFEKAFDKQIRAVMTIWTAKLVGQNRSGHVSLSLEFAGEEPRSYTYKIADFPHNEGVYDPRVNLNAGDFEIRIFHLWYRQPHGIKVGQARKYLDWFGGIHVYDGGFRLPYYGDRENDWLRIESDHSHRLVQSQLLPEELQSDRGVTGGLTYLPTSDRMFGVVTVDTSTEPNLDILITRDRLAPTQAFDDLRNMVRYAVDLYAQEEARRRYEETRRRMQVEPIPQRLEQVEEVLKRYQSEIPTPVYEDLRTQVREIVVATDAQKRRTREESGLLGALATAGISALAYQHELGKLFGTIRGLVDRIEDIRTPDQELQRELQSLSVELSSWLERAQATNALFAYLDDPENTLERFRFPAASVLADIKRQTAFLARGIEVDIERVHDDLLLPEASLAEWSAIFQNVFTNAFNAMHRSERRLLQVSSRSNDQNRQILLQDTGTGVKLEDADRLFQPFERATSISQDRRALGYGGTGLGLTIVRMISDRIGCRVRFVEPEEGFKTAFSIEWRESQ